MSRAASTDPIWGSTVPLAFWQPVANCRRPAIVDARALAVVGTGSGMAVGGAPGVSPQVTGSLRSTPRGSNMTTSKSSSRPGVSALSSLAMSSTPETPGPPGSITSDPMRAAGAFAWCRATAMETVWPLFGSA
jgi:hypothetical protein